MIRHKYGEFQEEQIVQYKEKLHGKIHWLLLNKDKHVKDRLPKKEFDEYFDYVLTEISGFDSLMNHPVESVELLARLEIAKEESLLEDFNFLKYRKIILDSHSLLDKICSEGGGSHDH